MEERDLLVLLGKPVMERCIIKILKNYEDERNLTSQFLDKLPDKYQRKELIPLEEIKNDTDVLESIANAPRLKTKSKDRQRAIAFLPVIHAYLNANYSI